MICKSPASQTRCYERNICLSDRALYFSHYLIMTRVSLSKLNGMVNVLRHFFWICTWENGQDLGKQQQDIWI